MNVFAELPKGLGNLNSEQRREVYRDLRSVLKISDSEPMLPLPADEIAVWSKRYAELIVPEFAQHPATQMSANRDIIEGGLRDYLKPATDEFLDSQLLYGPGTRAAGLSGIYLHAVVNWLALQTAVRAAREVLPAASAAIIEARYPAVVLLRHALLHEGYLGTSQLT